MAAADFDTVAGTISQTAQIKKFFWENATAPRLKGCRRPSFWIRVAEELYDVFFNSPYGYRSRYAISPEIGEQANRRVIELLIPKLCEYYGSEDDGLLLPVLLRGRGAKIWIYEEKVSEQMGRSEPDILYRPWQRASDDGAGLLAPMGVDLEVKGAWYDKAGREEVYDPDKADRSEQIHRTGYT